MIKKEPSKTKSEKAKDAYNTLEDKLADKFTVASIVFAVIFPVLLKLLEALAMINSGIPFIEQLTVFATIAFLLLVEAGLFILLYLFHEWKLRLDEKRSKLVDKDKLHRLINEEFIKLNQTIDDKAKETIMSTGIMVNGMNADPAETQEILTELENIDYSPNGVDKVDIDITRNALKVIEEQLAKQEQLELDNLTKDLPQDPEVVSLSYGSQVEFPYDTILPTGSNTEQHEYNKVTATRIDDPPIIKAVKEVASDREAELERQLAAVKDPEPEPEPEPEEEPEVFVDDKGNKYTFNADGSLNYI